MRIITTLREPIYQSWNRAIALARGKYITNANCDDLFIDGALRVLSDALDANPHIGLVYADSFVYSGLEGEQPRLLANELFPQARLNLPDYSFDELRRRYILGPCPLWRRTIWQRHPFNPNYQLAGDYEWALRISYETHMKRVGEYPLSLYYYGQNSTTLYQSHSDFEAALALMMDEERQCKTT